MAGGHSLSAVKSRRLRRDCSAIVFGEADPHWCLVEKATGASEKLRPEAPGSGLSVAHPNPSVANSLAIGSGDKLDHVDQ